MSNLFRGLKSKPKQYDSIDQERERISESSKPDNQGYRAMYEIPEPAVQERNEGEKSYIEQKKEEYRRYMPQQQEEVEEQNQYEQDYYDQEQRRLQMQYELEQEMERINRTNDLAKGNVQMNQDYENEYDERNGKGYNKEQDIGYQPLEQIVVKKVRPKAMVAAGGKSIRQQSEENKFTLSGYTNSEMKGKSKIFSNYETSSNVYGNTDHATLGKFRLVLSLLIKILGIALNARNMKAYGRQSSNKEKGFNVITGEYFD